MIQWSSLKILLHLTWIRFSMYYIPHIWGVNKVTGNFIFFWLGKGIVLGTHKEWIFNYCKEESPERNIREYCLGYFTIGVVRRVI